jgi:hypothetical protein
VRLAAIPAVIVLLLGGTRAWAQSAYEIQVYESETQDPGTTFAELHSNTATAGPPAGPGEVQPDRGSFHETLELTHGFTSWFETGFYVFSSVRSGEGWEWVGDHIRPRVRVPEEWDWPVGVSMSMEVGYLRERFSPTSWDMELRPIVDWRSGRLYAAINPAFEHGLAFYDGGSDGFQFAPNAKVSFDATKLASVGLEYYANVPDREHQLFPVLDLKFSPDWEFNAGAGFGLTPETDRFVLKLILGRRL